jgi:hypothetical protein
MLKKIHLALLLAVGATASSFAASNQELDSAAEGTKVYVGQEAVSKELAIIDLVIADASKRAVQNQGNTEELSELVARREQLRAVQATASESKAIGLTTQQISGCGQVLTLSVSNIGTPGGVFGAQATATMQTDGVSEAFVQGVLYAIAKNQLFRDSEYTTFGFNVRKLSAGTYSTSIGAGVSQSFDACMKAYASGTISNASNGSPLACGNVPIFIERETESTNNLQNCNLP